MLDNYLTCSMDVLPESLVQVWAKIFSRYFEEDGDGCKIQSSLPPRNLNVVFGCCVYEEVVTSEKLLLVSLQNLNALKAPGSQTASYLPAYSKDFLHPIGSSVYLFLICTSCFIIPPKMINL